MGSECKRSQQKLGKSHRGVSVCVCDKVYLCDSVCLCLFVCVYVCVCVYSHVKVCHFN